MPERMPERMPAIRMSRSPVGPPRLSCERSATTGAFTSILKEICRGWHPHCSVPVGGLLLSNLPLCSLPLTGCLYFGPLPRIHENEPPVIEQAIPSAGQTLIIKDQPIQIVVIATDPEGDGLEFLWRLSDGTSLGQAQRIDEGASLLELVPGAELDEESLDGEQLLCTVLDLYPGAPGAVTLSWPLEVP